MHRLLLFCVSVLLVSCGATKSSVSPEHSTTCTPALNKISEGEIGSALVTTEKGLKYNAIEITKAFTIKLGYTNKTIELGTLFINDYTAKNMDFYSHSSDATFGIAIPNNGENPMIYNSNDNDGIYTSGFSALGVNFFTPNERIAYIKTKEPAKGDEYFKQEFIYNGRVGNALKFIYREYLNDYARPAFTQDLQYDLSESDSIGFRGLRIQIIKATNINIEYKVLKYFDQ